MSLGPVILNKSLENKSIFRYLREKLEKIRVSTSTLVDTCIFPKSSLAFLILELVDESSNNGKKTFSPSISTEQITQRMKMFGRNHCNSLIIIILPLFNSFNLSIIGSIQQRLLPEKANILIANSFEEAGHQMITLVKMASPPAKDIIQERITKILKDYHTEDIVLNAVKSLNLNHQESTLLLDGCGSLNGLATASKEDLMNCSIESSKIEVINKFFE